MEAHETDFDEGPIALGQLGGRPVGILAPKKGHVTQQPWVLGPWKVR